MEQLLDGPAERLAAQGEDGQVHGVGRQGDGVHDQQGQGMHVVAVPPPRQRHLALLPRPRGSDGDRKPSSGRRRLRIHHEVLAAVHGRVDDLAHGEIEGDEGDGQVHVVLVRDHGHAEGDAVAAPMLHPASHQHVEEDDEEEGAQEEQHQHQDGVGPHEAPGRRVTHLAPAAFLRHHPDVGLRGDRGDG